MTDGALPRRNAWMENGDFIFRKKKSKLGKKRGIDEKGLRSASLATHLVLPEQY